MNKGQKHWDYQYVADHAVVNVFLPKCTHLHGHDVLKQKLQMIQKLECDNHLESSIINIYNESSVTWMQHAYNMGHKYAVFWFDGCWPKDTGVEDSIVRFANKHKEEEWLCAINSDDIASMMIVNLEFYLRWDPAKPNFQNYKFYAEEWIKKDTLELSDTLKKYICNTKPISDPVNFLNGLEGREYTEHTIVRDARVLIKKKTIPSSPIYFVNTEPSAPTTLDELNNKYFDQYVGVTAGFKLLYYAYSYGIDVMSTTFHWYDFDPHSCAFKQHMIENWDGVDYPAFVKQWCNNNPDANTELLHQVDSKWNDTIEHFGGETKWKHFWEDVQLCKHNFYTLDLITQNSEILKRLNNTSTFVFTSNIYSYILPKLMSQPFALEDSFSKLICDLQELDDCWYSGTDPYDNDITCNVKSVIGYSTNDSIGLEI